MQHTKMLWLSRGPSARAGSAAMEYFQTSFPMVKHYGEEGAYQNPAEWIVDLTTKVSLRTACTGCRQETTKPGLN